MRRLVTSLGMAVLAALVPVSTITASAAAETTTTVVQVPLVISPQGQSDIAACVGEPVDFGQGEFQVVRHQTVTDGGTALFLFHRNMLDAKGVGTITGTVYDANGHISTFQADATAGALAYNFDLVLNVVAQGGAAHFTADALEHVTIDADGNLTSLIEIESIRCT